MLDITLEEISSCPACGSELSELWSAAHDRLHQTTNQKFEYNRCLGCRSLYESVRPIQEDIWKCYPDNYGPYAIKNSRKTLIWSPKWFNKVTNAFSERIIGISAFRRRIGEIEGRMNQAGVMLDFGCGSGKYLDRAKKYGTKAIGMDFSKQALDQVSARGHRALPVDDSSWDALGEGVVGFVRMNHVIEHLYNPEAILRRIHRAMKPGATLHIATPNPMGPSAEIYRAAWWGLECPRHVVLISPDRVVAILRSLGFSKIEVINEPTAKDLARSWAYTLVDRNLISNEIIEGLAADGLLNLWFSWIIRNKIKRGEPTDRYHIVSVKSEI